MGAFDDVSTITIPDPNDPKKAEEFRKKWKWEAHEQVILRGSYTAAHMESVTNASVTSNLAKKNADIKLASGTGKIKLMEVMIVGWTLMRNGQPVEVTPSAIRQLPSNYRIPILEVCDELAGENMDEEEQERFLTLSNGHIGDNSKLEKTRLLK